MKGQRSRAGFSGMTGFEGGQIPLIRRLPKRGFRHSAFRTDFAVINVGEMEAAFESKATVNPEALREKGLVRGSSPVKVLGDGDLTKPLTIHAHAFSSSAKEKIQKAGGQIEILKK